MNAYTIAGQLGVLNFVVAAVLGVQLGVGEFKLKVPHSQLVLFLFIIATVALGFALGWLWVVGGFELLAQRTRILALAVAMATLFAHYGLGMASISTFTAPAASGLLIIHHWGNSLGMQGQSGRLELLLALHLAGAIMGQVMAIGASGLSVLFLWQQRLLKRKLLDQLPTKLPALDLLETGLVACLWAGFLFLSVALFSGAFAVGGLSGMAGSAYHSKIAWAVGVWGWYLAVLLGRYGLSCAVKRTAQMSLVGLLPIGAAFFGLVFFP